MTSQYLSANPNPNVAGIIFYGFPLHPAGKPSIERADHLKKHQHSHAVFTGLQRCTRNLGSYRTSVCINKKLH